MRRSSKARTRRAERKAEARGRAAATNGSAPVTNGTALTSSDDAPAEAGGNGAAATDVTESAQATAPAKGGKRGRSGRRAKGASGKTTTDVTGRSDAKPTKANGDSDAGDDSKRRKRAKPAKDAKAAKERDAAKGASREDRRKPASPAPRATSGPTRGSAAPRREAPPAQPAGDVSADVVAAELAPRVRGPVLVPDHDGYDAERTGHNLAVDHHPGVVVGATGPADVTAAVGFASRHDLAVGVVATGHGPAVPADGGVLINTSRMSGVRVDPMARVARVEAGARWEQVIHEAAAFGLAPLSGSSPEVGAVGYTLGGGLGLLGRAFGYAADHVRSVDIVTATGSLRQVTPQQYADLFWALRGGKGNFGVVTSMEIALFPVPTVYGGGLYFRGSSAPEVCNAYRRWVKDLPEEMGSSIALVRFPWDADVPEQLRGRVVVHVRVAYHGSEEEGRELVAPLRSAALPLIDDVGVMPYAESGRIHNDPTEPERFHERTLMLDDLDEDLLDELLWLAGPDSACPLRILELRHLGGALAREPEIPNAVSHREAGFLLYLSGVESHAGGTEVDGFTALAAERLQPWATGGVSVNFAGSSATTPDEVRDAYSEEHYRRLAKVKWLYDPDNLFRINHNIPPSPAA